MRSSINAESDFEDSSPVSETHGVPSHERDLLQRAVSGDREALGKLLENHSGSVRRSLEGKIDGRWQSQLSEDDVLQQTFADAFQGIHRFHGESEDAFRKWLICIARNNLLDALKHIRAAKSGGLSSRAIPGSDESYHRLMQEISAGQSTPSMHVARVETNERLENAITRLPPAYSLIVRSYDLGSKSAEDLAKELGCSTGAFYMRRSRAHAMLAKLLEGASATEPK